MSRELSIIYNTLTMSEDPARIDGKYKIEQPTAGSMRVSFFVIVTGTSAADFASNCDALQDEFRIRFKRLRILLDGVTLHDFNPATDSAFNHEPFIRKVGHDLDSGRARRYECGVDMQLPADDNSGRRWSSVSVHHHGSGRRTVTISGQYTAQGGTAARANYDAKADTYCSTVLSGLGGVYDDPEDEAQVETDDQDKLCDWSRTYEEILYDQSAAGANHSAVVRHSVQFKRTMVGPGDTAPGDNGGIVKRLQVIQASYSCQVRFSEETDLTGLWENVLRSYVLSEAETRLGGKPIAITVDELDYEKADQTFFASLEIVMSGGNQVIEYRASQRMLYPTGKVYVPTANGNRFERNEYQGPEFPRRVTTIRRLDLLAAPSLVSSVPILGKIVKGGSEREEHGSPYEGGTPSSGNWRVVNYEQEFEPEVIGIVELGRTHEAMLSGHVLTEEYHELADNPGAPTGEAESDRADRGARSTRTPISGGSAGAAAPARDGRRD